MPQSVSYTHLIPRSPACKGDTSGAGHLGEVLKPLRHIFMCKQHPAKKDEDHGVYASDGRWHPVSYTHLCFQCEAQRCIHNPLSTRLSSTGCFLCAIAHYYLFLSTPFCIYEVIDQYMRFRFVCQEPKFIFQPSIFKVRPRLYLVSSIIRETAYSP